MNVELLWREITALQELYSQAKFSQAMEGVREQASPITFEEVKQKRNALAAKVPEFDVFFWQQEERYILVPKNHQ
jgi:hypothetical protein